MQSVNRNVFVIGGIAAAMVLLLIVGLIATNNHNPSGTGADRQVYDKNSGDTLSSPVGKGPDVYGLLPNTPVYLGLSNLLQYGLSDEQIQDIKYAYYVYATSVNPHIRQVSVSNNITSVPRDPNSMNPFALTFNTVFDNKTTMSAKVQYADTNSVELFLYDSSGHQKFDSGVLSGKSVETN